MICDIQGLHMHIINNWNNLSSLDRIFSQHKCVSPWDQSKESLRNIQQQILIFALPWSRGHSFCGRRFVWGLTKSRRHSVFGQVIAMGYLRQFQWYICCSRSSNGKCYTYTYQRVVIVYFLSDDVIILPVTSYACSAALTTVFVDLSQYNIFVTSPGVGFQASFPWLVRLSPLSMPLLGPCPLHQTKDYSEE